MRKITLVFLVLLLFPLHTHAQNDSDNWIPPPPPYYSFINYSENVISEKNTLDSVFRKLLDLHHTKKGRVNIIHIGDSHLQADGITSVLRDGFHDFFGDAGRGLVFPYQLANSNAPHDIAAKSNVAWKNNRLTFPDKPILTGICGYAIQTESKNATINIKLKAMEGKQERFNRMVFFMCNDSVCYRITDSALQAPLVFYTNSRPADQPCIVNTDSLMTGFELTRVGNNDNQYRFYGVSLEKKDSSGVLYHSIGVNGARYDQFLNNDLFWAQVKALNGDLVILSLGTNEAQNPHINEQAFADNCDAIIKRIHTVAPGARILITTPMGSFYHMKKPNPSIGSVTNALVKYCTAHNVPFWDLFNIGNGLKGTPMLKKYDLLSHDLIHYNNIGYQLQGLLLLNAFSKGYDSYAKTHPWKAPKPMVTMAPKPHVANKPKVIKEEIEKPIILSFKKPGTDTIAAKQQMPPVPPPPAPHISNIKVEYGN